MSDFATIIRAAYEVLPSHRSMPTDLKWTIGKKMARVIKDHYGVEGEIGKFMSYPVEIVKFPAYQFLLVPDERRKGK